MTRPEIEPRSPGPLANTLPTRPRDEIWQRKMYHANNEKRKTTNERWNRTTKPRKNQNARKKGNLQIPRDIESGRHQTRGDEKNLKNNTSGEPLNKTTLQKFHRRDKRLGCSPRKILGDIIKVDERRTSTNGPENKKPMTIHQVLHLRDDVDMCQQKTHDNS